MPSRGKITTCPCVLLLCYMILQCDWNIADNRIAYQTLGYYYRCKQIVLREDKSRIKVIILSAKLYCKQIRFRISFFNEIYYDKKIIE